MLNAWLPLACRYAYAGAYADAIGTAVAGEAYLREGEVLAVECALDWRDGALRRLGTGKPAALSI